MLSLKEDSQQGLDTLCLLTCKLLGGHSQASPTLAPFLLYGHPALSLLDQTAPLHLNPILASACPKRNSLPLNLLISLNDIPFQLGVQTPYTIASHSIISQSITTLNTCLTNASPFVHPLCLYLISSRIQGHVSSILLKSLIGFLDFSPAPPSLENIP